MFNMIGEKQLQCRNLRLLIGQHVEQSCQLGVQSLAGDIPRSVCAEPDKRYRAQRKKKVECT